jgi:uncharacterized protein (DUF2147 family)/peroxiredoxin
MRLPALALALLATFAASATAADLTGRWRAASGNVEVDIAPCGAALCGTIVRVLSDKSMADPTVEMKDVPGLGLVVLSNFLPAGDGSFEGFIYDRESRKTYSCTMSLASPDRLSLHPYVGISMLGQTQIWSRVAADGTTSSRDDFGAAPEFVGIERWVNSPPLSLAALRGKVVLIDFWTSACGNCIHALPHVEKWHETYASQGLVVVGVHTPETPAEALPETVDRAVKRWKLQYPIAQDNDYETWKAYGNHYWPAVYLIDAKGRIALRNYGEGSYDDIETAIQELLRESKRNGGLGAE